MPLSLAAPQYVILLILLVPIILLGTRGRKQSSGSLRTVVLVLRCLVVALLIMALAQPRWSTSRSVSVIFLADTSASVPQTTQAAEATWLRAAGRANVVTAPVGLISFAGTPQVRQLMGTATSAASLLQNGLTVQQSNDQTNIEAALRLALAVSPAHSRFILLSDGRETIGSARSVVATAQARSITIDPVILTPTNEIDAAMVRLQAPPLAHTGDTLPLFVTIHSTVNRQATLTLWQDDLSVGSQPVSLRVGDNPFEVVLPAIKAGQHIFRAQVTLSGDQVPQNDELTAVTSVAGVPRILIVGFPNSQLHAFTQRLTAAGLDVRELAPRAFPASMRDLSAYDAVVLSNVPATALTVRQVAALDGSVRGSGTGLLVLGGDHSLTLGNYTQTALERILPVYSVTPGIFQQGSIALQLVLDKSGSMDNLAGDYPKIQMAQQAALDAIKFASQYHDELGIVSFDFTPAVLVPRQDLSARSVIARAEAAVSGLQADGGTNIYAALKLGLQQIVGSSAPYKHMVLMTDGRSDPADYRGLLETIRREHITLSTIGLGSDADVDLLRRLAAAGRGRFYFTADAATLPRLFIQEARLSAGPTRVSGDIPVTVSNDSPVLRSLANQTLPHVLSYPATTVKPDASLVLMARARGQIADPIMAQWDYGLGRVIVWTPGLAQDWAGPWLTHSATFWTDAVRWVVRGIRPQVLQPQVTLQGDQLLFSIDTLQTSGSFLELARLDAQLRSPDGVPTRVIFAQTAPGLYQAVVPAAGPGIYQLSVHQRAKSAQLATADLAVPYLPEYLPRPPNRGLLVDLATLTGGTVLTDPRQSFTALPLALDRSATDLWWPLLLVALVLLLLDVVLRLSGWPRGLSRRSHAVGSLEAPPPLGAAGSDI